MDKNIIPFGRTRGCIEKIFHTPDSWPADAPDLYAIRDLYGRVRIALSETVRNDSNHDRLTEFTKRITDCLRKDLGPHAYPSEDSVLYVPSSMFQQPGPATHKIHPHENVFLVERLMIGHSWWTVEKDTSRVGSAKRYVLYSVMGGVGCTTTTAVLAWHLARAGERVMVVDLDLESPGLASAMLATRFQPEFGIVDWFVEDIVGQGDGVIEQMSATPSWSRDFPGEVFVIPAHGREPGEFLAKLGRTHLQTVDKESGRRVAWGTRLGGLLSRLEEIHKPTVVLLESGSGLGDIPSSVVTDLDARILLFAVDSVGTWENYQVLFRHWRDNDLAAKIRQRLSVISALTPGTQTDSYLTGFRERAWNLFQDFLYDRVDSSENSIDQFAFDLKDGNQFSPHTPIPILWTEGLASGTSLRDPEQSEAPIQFAYNDFLEGFDRLARAHDEE